MKINQTGRTMIEVILFLGIMAVVVIGFIRVINVVLNRYKISRTVQQLYELQRSISKRYAIIGDYGDLADPTGTRQEEIAHILADTAGREVSRIAPYDMTISGGFLRHRFGGRVRVRARNLIDIQDLNNASDIVGIEGENKAYEITFEDVPKSLCVDMALMNWVVNDSTDLIGVRFGTDLNRLPFRWPRIGENPDTNPNINYLPVTVVDAMSNNNCPEVRRQTISWTFY